MAVLLLVLASCPVMGGADGVETVGVAVGIHVAQLGHLFGGAAAAVLVGVHVLVVWLVDCQELSNGSGELLDLGCYCSEFGVLAKWSLLLVHLVLGAKGFCSHSIISALSKSVGIINLL